VTPPRSPWTAGLAAWLNFWFYPVSGAQLAALRIGTGLVLLYLLFVTSFDLEAHFGVAGWGEEAALRVLDPLAWPFSVLHWFPNPFWLWAVHVLAIIVAVAFLIGILPFWSGSLMLFFLLSYSHRNPAVLVGLDALLWMALFYLLLTPCGRMFGVMATAPPPQPAYVPGLEARAPGPHWEGFPIRVLQVHLCILYFLAGLAKLTPDWLAGTVFWHPRLVETGVPLAQETLRAHPQWSALVIYGVLLFLLFFPILVWMRRFRYPMLGLALGMHLGLGAVWGHLPVHLLMLVLLLAFVEPAHLDAALQRILGAFGWWPGAGLARL
jgi:hypothetical protein